MDELNSRRRLSSSAAARDSSNKLAYTLTACIRCRTRKSRCDPGLPKCALCQKHNEECEYWDAGKRKRLSRRYIVHMQDRVTQLEEAVARAEMSHDLGPDQEALLREAAVVQFKATDERKYLGPSSGTTLTRLVMQLAKQTLGVTSIHEIISHERSRQAETRAHEEGGKATSKVDPESYPLVSSYAAKELPGRALVNLLVQLYNVKVQSMYPLLHEPELDRIFEDVYRDDSDPFKNFVVRMIIAIGLQRMDTKYAGAGDSFYLGALGYFEAAVKPMNLQTLQCFNLIGEYSLLTPTRTAVYYVVGLAVRLLQALGLSEERSLVRNPDGSPASPLEIDLKRRAFWSTLSMDYGLAHALGRPAMMSTDQDCFDVDFPKAVDDKYISHHGIVPGHFSTRKWIAIHFYKMRLLQLEIRRVLYRRKRDTPTSDSDPWFRQMERKLDSWRLASPHNDDGSGFSDVWFRGRYHTMIVMLFRPSPQVPTPSARAAILCYEACEYNIHMQRSQIRDRSVELTWIFTQSIFMTVNTILWCVSFAEVRNIRTREEVQSHLDVALEGIKLASERWPGVESALQLYEALVGAIMTVYEKDGDISIHDPGYVDSDVSSSCSFSRSRTTSPSLYGPGSFASRLDTTNKFAWSSASDRETVPTSPSLLVSSPRSFDSNSMARDISPNKARHRTGAQDIANGSIDPNSQFNALPSTFPDMSNWSFDQAVHQPHLGSVDYNPFMDPYLHAESAGNGQYHYTGAADDEAELWPWANNDQVMMDQSQQNEVMQSLENHGMDDLMNMIEFSSDMRTPRVALP
ncbi:MAG: hypothetical protein M1828_006428 [Chrysothrix sp. TS-e1954]|nr:MAG: hypothetical protein M1828_006428 [Chrysothrix sp. TS-e1954]